MLFVFVFVFQVHIEGRPMYMYFTLLVSQSLKQILYLDFGSLTFSEFPPQISSDSANSK